MREVRVMPSALVARIVLPEPYDVTRFDATGEAAEVMKITCFSAGRAKHHLYGEAQRRVPRETRLAVAVLLNDFKQGRSLRTSRVEAGSSLLR